VRGPATRDALEAGADALASALLEPSDVPPLSVCLRELKSILGAEDMFACEFRTGACGAFLARPAPPLVPSIGRQQDDVMTAPEWPGRFGSGGCQLVMASTAPIATLADLRRQLPEEKIKAVRCVAATSGYGRHDVMRILVPDNATRSYASLR
jgi:hypothetical protein